MTTYTPALERSLPVRRKGTEASRDARPRCRSSVHDQRHRPVVHSASLWAFYTSLRSYSETSKYGYLSLPHHLTFVNFRNAWTQGDMVHFFWNSVIMTVPAVIITLFFASSVAFVLSRFSFWFNIPLLIIFAAGNLLPPQVMITPLYRIYLTIHVPHVHQQQRSAVQLLRRSDRHQRLVPAGLLRLRAQQLHEDASRTRSPRLP